MHHKQTALAVLVALLLLASCKKTALISSEVISPEIERSSTSRTTANSGADYLILCKTEAVSDKLLARINALGKVKQSLGQIGIVTASSSNANFKAELEKLAEVQSVLPDLKLNWLKSTFDEARVVSMGSESATQGFPESQDMGLSGTNPYLPMQWSLLSVDAKAAFIAGYKGHGAVVAVLDGGFHLQHPDIKDNIMGTPVSFVPGEAAQRANMGFSHGTHVAGIVAASDNNIGTVGIAPSAKLMLVKVLNDLGSGDFSWLIQGVVYAADNGADIINMSLGAVIPRNGRFLVDNGTPNDPSDDVIINEARLIQDLIVGLNRAFQYARSKGALPIAAAGNEGIHVTGQGQGSFYPADCSGVIAVASNSPRDWVLNPGTSLYEASSYTNTGSSLIDLAGPGGDADGSTTLFSFLGIPRPSWVYDMVVSPGSMIGGVGRYNWAAGTSMASPAAAGVAALIVGKYGGNISPAHLESKLKASAVDIGKPGKDHYSGHGQVNAGKAVQQ
jgi:subtilisin family serine protease